MKTPPSHVGSTSSLLARRGASWTPQSSMSMNRMWPSLGHMVSLSCGEGSANMRFCVSTLIVSRVGVGHCVDVGIVLYHQKEVIIGLVGLRGASVSWGGIGNLARLGIQLCRRWLLHESKVSDALFLFDMLGHCPIPYSFGTRCYGYEIFLLHVFAVDS